MQALDGTILNTALPSIAADLGYSPLAMQSVIVSYTITLALFIPLSGWLSDKFGTRRVFSIAVALFVAGSLCCALAQSLPQLILSRILQGMGGSMMVPVARLTVLYVYPKNKLLSVMNFIAIPGLAGTVIGPTLGGWLVELSTWHMIFLINIPIGLAGIWAAIKIMPQIRRGQGKFDLTGFILFSGSLSLLTFCLEASGSGTIPTRLIVILVLLSLLLISLYIIHARRIHDPLINLSLFRIRTLRVGLLGNFATRLGIGGFPLLLPLMLQVGFGYPPSTAGMMLIPMALANVISKPLVVPIIRRFGHKNTLVANTLMLAILISMFSLLTEATPLIYIIPLLIAYGMVSSIQFTTMNTISIADLDEHNSSEGNSVVAVSQQLSISFGISLAGLLMLTFNNLSSAGENNDVVFQYSFLTLGIVTALSTLVFNQLKATDGEKLSGRGGYD